MAQKPLHEMADIGYDNMSEEAGYVLSELKTFAATATSQLEKKADKTSLNSVWQVTERNLESKAEKSAVNALSTKLESYPTADTIRQSINWASSAINGLMTERRTARYVFSYEDGKLSGTYPLSGILLNTDYIVVNCFVQITETFSSDDTAADDTSIAIELENPDDLIAAIKISDVSNTWDNGFKSTAVNGQTNTFVKVSAPCAPKVVVLNGAGVTEGLTSGKLEVFIDFYIKGE